MTNPKPTYTLVSDDEVPDNCIIPEEGWALKIDDVIVGINLVKVAEEENEDGTRDIDIDYDVLEGKVPDDFGNIIGEVVIDILEQSMKVRDMKTAIEEARENR